VARSFNHRTAFGAWINDTRNEAMPDEKWPYVVIDEQTVGDTVRCLELQARAGFNEFDIFGLFTSYAWPLDIRSAVDDERAQRVRAILDAAHDLGIRVLCGLGVYSWGFDEIIRQRPGVRGTNPQAMCGSQEEAWDWMAKVIDFILSDFEVDGFHFESSDQGRCSCPKCAELGNVEYHCRLNSRVADYIHDRWPDKVLMMNMCGYVPWGETLPTTDLPHLATLGEHLDCLIDPGHVGKGFIDESHRRDFIESLHCDFGTSGGAWVYPPQRWDRLRWFLPYTNATGRHMRRLFEDGGRAVDYYMGPTSNPGVEMNIAFGGRLMSNVDRSDEEILSELVDELYEPRTDYAREQLVDVFKRAERAYYETYHPFPPRSRDSPGELHLAPLFGTDNGPAIYLAGTRPDDQPLESVGLATYRNELLALLDDVTKLHGAVDDGGRTQRIETCLRNVLADIDAL
jgi:hypothetical protein